MKKAFLLFAILCIGIATIQAQCTITITGATTMCDGNTISLTANIEREEVNCDTIVNMCNGNTTVTCGQGVCFYDDGGSTAYYSNNANYTHTFTSNNGGPLTITFGNSRLQASGDSLFLHDGPITAPLLNQGHESGSSMAYQTYTATSGTLTVRFISNNSANAIGWQSTISCDQCGQISYSWSNGEHTPSINVSPSSTTTYTCTVTSTVPGCCSGSASHTVVVNNCGGSACPQINPTDINGNTTVYLNCETGLQATFYANAVATAMEANDYTVASIPHNPPFSYTAGNRIFSNATDDTWGPTQTLPFSFCYYGNTYTQIVPGANSIASFDPHSDGSGCAWSYSASLPSPSLFLNTIFACYRDIYPSSSDYNSYTGDGGIYQGVMGEYPCRSYMLSFNNIKLYSCTSIRSFSSMIVLYEGTNIIDIYLRDAPTCTSWNSGNGCIGIQNSTGTAAVVPPGRNTGPWTTSYEAWRFTPTGTPTYTVTWYEGTDTSAATGIVVGEGDQVDVFPSGSTTYTARLRFTACNGNDFDLINTCQVVVNDITSDIMLVVSKDTTCPGEPVTLMAYADNAESYQWSTGNTGSSFTIVPEDVHNNYEVTVTFENGCMLVDSIQVHAVDTIAPPVFPAIPDICYGESTTISVDPHEYYLWSTGGVTQSITVTPDTTTTYVCTVSNAEGCQNSDSITVVVIPTTQADFVPYPERISIDEDVQFINISDTSHMGNNYTWSWDFGDGNTSEGTEANATHSYDQWGEYLVTLTFSTPNECNSTITHSVYVDAVLEFPNVITPNGDGTNDVFAIRNLNPNSSNILTIYNRWGKKVYEKENYKTYCKTGDETIYNPTEGFTAEGLSDGVYYYTFHYVGYTKSIDYHNSLTVIRGDTGE